MRKSQSPELFSTTSYVCSRLFHILEDSQEFQLLGDNLVELTAKAEDSIFLVDWDTFGLEQTDEIDKKTEKVNEACFLCKECDESFPTGECLRRHLCAVSSSPMTCEVCSNSFTNSCSLKIHQKSAHPNFDFSLKIHKKFANPDSSSLKTLQKSAQRGASSLKMHQKSARPDSSSLKILQKSAQPGANQKSAHLDSYFLKYHQESDHLYFKTQESELKKSYNCKLCKMILTSAIAMLNHKCPDENSKKRAEIERTMKKEVVNGKTVYVCIHCDKRFPMMRRLVYNAAMLKHRCSINDEAKRRRIEFERTLKEETVDGKTVFGCPRCDKKFSTKQRLYYHQPVHSETKAHVCPFCSKAFKTSGSLFNHKKVLHSGDLRPHECQLCNRRFKKRYGLRVHLATHSSERPHVCEICGKTFKLIYVLNLHKKRHHPNNVIEKNKGVVSLKCNWCKVVFENNEMLKIHKCEKRELFMCELCSATYKTHVGLVCHKRRDHEKRRDHKCSYCEKSFFDKHSLKLHEERHTAEKKQCEICLRYFSSSQTLRAHVKIHTGVRPFTCHVCGKTFRLAGNYRIHMRIHTGEKPYSCSICGRAFTQKGDRDKHERSIHNKFRPKGRSRLT